LANLISEIQYARNFSLDHVMNLVYGIQSSNPCGKYFGNALSLNLYKKGKKEMSKKKKKKNYFLKRKTRVI
jgi:hypothetical protein